MISRTDVRARGRARPVRGASQDPSATLSAQALSNAKQIPSACGMCGDRFSKLGQAHLERTCQIGSVPRQTLSWPCFARPFDSCTGYSQGPLGAAQRAARILAREARRLRSGCHPFVSQQGQGKTDKHERAYLGMDQRNVRFLCPLLEIVEAHLVGQSIDGLGRRLHLTTADDAEFVSPSPMRAEPSRCVDVRFLFARVRVIEVVGCQRRKVDPTCLQVHQDGTVAPRARVSDNLRENVPPGRSVNDADARSRHRHSLRLRQQERDWSG